MLHYHEKHPDGVLIRPVEEVLFSGRTKDQRVDIVRHANLGRVLYLDSCFQSDDTFEQPYHDRMVDLIEGTPQTVLILGSGPGGLTKTVEDRFPAAQVVSVEKDREAVAIYRQYLPDWGRFNHPYIADAFELDYPGMWSYDTVLWDIDADTLPPNLLEALPDLLRRMKAQRNLKQFIATAGTLHVRPDVCDPYQVLHRAILGNFAKVEERLWPEMFWRFFRAQV